MFVPIEKSRLQALPRTDDPTDRRLASYVQAVGEGDRVSALEQIGRDDIILIGYPDDRGVDRNGGRIGSAEGPEAVRKHLYKMTPPGDRPLPTNLKIWDLGDLMCWSMDLLEAHERARETIRDLRQKGARILTIGGGHDRAYPDFVDFQGHVLNVDAHLDMRPNPTEPARAGHSGTPFRRILSAQRNPPRVSAVGLQRHCNAHAHLEWSKGHRVTTIFLEDFPANPEAQWEQVSNTLELKNAGPYALSIDLDAFAAADAPGVSAPQPQGVSTGLVFRMIRALRDRTRHLGLYELNPKYDVDDHTARLAARLAFEFIFG